MPVYLENSTQQRSHCFLPFIRENKNSHLFFSERPEGIYSITGWPKKRNMWAFKTVFHLNFPVRPVQMGGSMHLSHLYHSKAKAVSASKTCAVAKMYHLRWSRQLEWHQVPFNNIVALQCNEFPRIP
jgi:hypothetical protein